MRNIMQKFFKMTRKIKTGYRQQTRILTDSVTMITEEINNFKEHFECLLNRPTIEQNSNRNTDYYTTKIDKEIYPKL